VNKYLVLAWTAYVAAVTWIGYQGADPAIREAFGSSTYLLLGLLAVLYGGTTAATVWFVSFLSKFSFSFATAGSYPTPLVSRQTSTLLTLALFCRIPALLGQQLWHTPSGVAALAIPALAASVMAARDRGLTLPGKLLAYLPFAAYLAMDGALLLTLARA